MKIEAIKVPLTYRWPGGEIYLVPGKPVDLPQDRALKLLKKIGPKVRQIKVANKEARLRLNQSVTFESPIFGSCSGYLTLIEGNMALVDHHSVLHTLTSIRVDWITEVLEQEDSNT